MKRFRHYTEDTAIVLACFGSVVEQGRYQQLADEVQQAYPDYPVSLAISSRMVIKKLAAKGQSFRNLPQTLADLDMAGFRRIVVVSTYLYPTEEHAWTKKTVAAFGQFSLSRFAVTPSLLNKSRTATQILQGLHQRFESHCEVANLFVLHGSPELEQSGFSSIQYSRELLGALSPYNHCCSLEGGFPYWALKDNLIATIKERSRAGGWPARPKLRLVPLLLVSGNHFDNDMAEMKAELSEHFDVFMADPLPGERNFCLLSLPEIRQTLIEQIELELKKMP